MEHMSRVSIVLIIRQYRKYHKSIETPCGGGGGENKVVIEKNAEKIKFLTH
jgi:hypothetical protein